MGDAVLELLGPASLESPIWKRPPGLVGMASWEDLDAAVALARAAGFAVTDPAAGVLPGTRTATIQGPNSPASTCSCSGTRERAAMGG
jgi:hypothetical protein